MTPEQTRLVRGNWAADEPIADAAAQLFYQRLFEIEPAARRLFADVDMTTQRSRLIDALGLVATNLERPELMAGALEDLGRRHAGYGVEDRHFDSVGAALIWTLEQGLGPAFTSEARAAWLVAYALATTPMRRGMASAQREGRAA